MQYNKEKVEMLRRDYPAGTRVELIQMKGEQQMPSGLHGTVDMVDDIGQIHVKWSNGSSLALNTEVDSFRKLPKPDCPLIDVNKNIYNLMGNASAAFHKSRERNEWRMRNYDFYVTYPCRPLHIVEKDVYYHSSDEFTLTPCGKPYKVEMVVELSHEQFQHFANNQMQEYDFIAENKDLMFYETPPDGCTHGLLVLGKGWKCGYILDPGGTDCAVYCAQVPKAREIVERLYPEMTGQNSTETEEMGFEQSM